MAESSGLFVVGTDTGVGKSYLSAMILRELRAAGVPVGAFKPACSGVELDASGRRHWPDLELLADAAGLSDIRDICPYRLDAPAAPPVAAQQAGVELQEDVMRDGLQRCRARARFTVVEGVGGLLCPLTQTQTIADFAAWARLPVLIVSRLGLGAINHTLLTLEVAERRGLDVVGVVLNDCLNEASTVAGQTNVAEIQRWTALPVLGVVPFRGTSLCLWPDMCPARIAWQSLSSRPLS